MGPLSSFKVAVTGAGAITAAGAGILPLVEAITSAKSCLTPVPSDIAAAIEGLTWGMADFFKATDFIPPLKARKLDRGSQLALAASILALADAGIAKGSFDPEMAGIALGCGFGGIANSAEMLAGYFQHGVSGLLPMLFPNTVSNAPASNTSIELGLKGPNITFVQRFCSAESAILAACRFIEEGRADIILAGGVDELTPLMIQGFAATGQLATHARGFGEGAGIVVLENPEHARMRGAVPKGHILRIGTVGMIFPEDIDEGLNRLIGSETDYSRIFVTGSDAPGSPFAKYLESHSHQMPGTITGRSLAMGGVSLAALASMTKSDETGLQLATSPEGPYFAISISGGAI